MNVLPEVHHWHRVNDKVENHTEKCEVIDSPIHDWLNNRIEELQRERANLKWHEWWQRIFLNGCLAAYRCLYYQNIYQSPPYYEYFWRD